MIALDKVRDWINVNVVDLRSERYITDHFDMTGLEGSEVISNLIKVLVSTPKYLEREYPELGMIIVLNLKTYAEGELTLKLPKKLGVLVDDLDESSPPTLYVTRPDSKSVRDITEEYKLPIDFLESE